MSLRIVGAGVVAVAVAVALATWAYATPSRADRQADTIDAKALAVRVARLEALASVASDPGGARTLTFDSSYAHLRERVEMLEAIDAVAWRRIPTLAPVPGAVLSSPYSGHRMHPLLHRVQPHLGVDLASEMGTPIRAAGDGVVRAAAYSTSYGNAIDIDHGNGFVTRYGHASKLYVVAGDHVTRGQLIGLVGNTGLSTGPHLHYEVFYAGWSIDPSRVLRFVAPTVKYAHAQD